MATIPSPRTWATGDTVFATHFNTDLRDSQVFLLNRPRVMVYDSTGVSIQQSDGETLLEWDTEVFDTDGMHSTGTNPSRLTCVTSGVYEIIAHIDWQGHNDTNAGSRWVSINKNNNGGLTMATSAEIAADAINCAPNDGADLQVSHIVFQHFLTAGDYIEVVVRNIVTDILSTNGQEDHNTFFAARWIGSQ
jgi:hypothetical protein